MDLILEMLSMMGIVIVISLAVLAAMGICAAGYTAFKRPRKRYRRR